MINLKLGILTFLYSFHNDILTVFHTKYNLFSIRFDTAIWTMLGTLTDCGNFNKINKTIHQNAYVEFQTVRYRLFGLEINIFSHFHKYTLLDEDLFFSMNKLEAIHQITNFAKLGWNSQCGIGAEDWKNNPLDFFKSKMNFKSMNMLLSENRTKSPIVALNNIMFSFYLSLLLYVKSW